MTQTEQQHDRQWQGWCDNFDIVYREVLTMFHNRHIWKNLIAMLERNSAKGDTAVIKNWIIRTYVATQCSTMRRLNDDRRGTISFRRCLDELIKTPTLVTQARYEHLARFKAAKIGIEDEVLYGPGFAGYADFADAGRDQLNRAWLKSDRDKLANATALVERYTNERIAHIGHRADLSALTFGDLDRAINVVGDMTRKYYRLRHPGETLAWITPDCPASWLTAFEHPWWTPDFRPIGEPSLG